MKTPRFLLIGVPIIIVILAVSYLLGRPHHRHHEEQAKADQAVASTNAPENAPPAGRGHMRAILDQLNLTDAQKAQIDQIRQTTTDRQQRRAAILNVLTPDQRTKFQQLRAAAGAPPAPAQ